MSDPCDSCLKGVTKASKAVSCDNRDRWTHVRCTPLITLEQYERCVKDGAEIDFICDNCARSSLPFHLVDSGAAGDDEVDAATAVCAPSRSIPLLQFQRLY